MASTIIRTPAFRAPTARPSTTCSSLQSPKPFNCVSFRRKQTRPKGYHSYTLHPSTKSPSQYLPKLSPCASQGETTETDDKEVLQESVEEDNSDGAEAVENSASEGETVDDEAPASAIMAALQAYKQALASDDESRVVDLEAFFTSIQDEKINLEKKVFTLSEELSYEKDRILRISADFENFRKRTERERISVVSNAQGEVVETLLSVLDNFERAKAHIKVETEAEEKIVNSYQSIYKQFTEILASLGVVAVDTTGTPFDPLLHEAIMREDSSEFEEGVIIDEFRKGFKLGDRLLRPSMVKVSAGPGPGNPEPVEASIVSEDGNSSVEEGSSVAESAAN